MLDMDAPGVVGRIIGHVAITDRQSFNFPQIDPIGQTEIYAYHAQTLNGKLD